MTCRKPPAAVRHAWFKALGTAFLRLVLIVLATLAAYLHQHHAADLAQRKSLSAAIDEPDLDQDRSESLDMDNDGTPEL
ncbi:hypothetical protein [Solimonas soli]|uniref:hypothetical protein n=1 Tax=Solimonas soli TaxID=413479 RepID=UPI000486F31B|nr:hypothetical protein [Solimonas soli]